MSEAPDSVRRKAPWVTAPQVETAGASPLQPTSLLRLQRSAGNAAVCAILAARPEPTLGLTRSVDMKTINGEAKGDEGDVVDARLAEGGSGAAPVTVRTVTRPMQRRTKVVDAATVKLPKHIRAASSPKGMPDRIPPRVDTTVHVGISGVKSGSAPVILSIAGDGGGNGSVTIDGQATKSMSGSGDVKLRGQVQTDAGNGGGLSLVAEQSQRQIATSNGFSVSSVPQNYTDTFVSELTGDKRGFVVQDGWDSDSGVFTDLDETEISEQVEVTKATGCWKGVGKSNSGYLRGDRLSQDTHSDSVSTLTKPGTRVATQTCMFKDKRSGATDIPMTRSGYKLVREVAKKSKSAGGGLQYHITKKGASVTANGIKSKAGSGSIDKTQDV